MATQGIANRRSVLGLAVAAATLPGAALAGRRLSGGTCQRSLDNQINLTWSGPPVDVRMANGPDGPFATVLATKARTGWRGEIPISPRPYFRLVTEASHLDLAERLLPLQGGRNFRDLGGYFSADGRQVRWGRLFRSGSMVDLTLQDFSYLSSLGVTVICDFRSISERSQEPTRWPGPSAPRIFSRDYEMDRTVQRSLIDGRPDVATMRTRMIAFYEALPYDHIDSYRTMFAKLLAGQVPLAFNCSAGKDRTGVGAALLLTTLGVRWNDVLSDYTLTNDLIDYEAIFKRAPAGNASSGFSALYDMSPEVRAQLYRAEPEYLQAAFDAIKRREGSLATFIRLRLGVSDADIGRLQARLLAPT